MEFSDEKEFTIMMEKHYINYIGFANCVVRLIKQIAVGGARDYPQREDILSMLLSNLFAYTFSFQECTVTNIQVSHVEFQK